MALTDESGGMNTTMLVSPANGVMNGNCNNGFGFGNDSWAWIILLLLLGWGNNGWGNGYGNAGALAADGAMLYPWMNQADLTSRGFQNQLLNDNVTSIRDGISGLSTQLCNCCGDISTQLCNGFSGVNATVNSAQNAISQQLYTNQISDLERSFAAQTATTQGMNNIGMSLQNCCCENRAGIADLKYTIATENCADRAALSDGIRDLLAATQAQTQTILTQLCNDKIEAKNDTIAQLRQELLFARGQASQDVQTADLRANNALVANQLVSELRSCPIPAQPVYGNQPIFTCPQTYSGCGCGCN